jgi:hypothetical protein
MSLIKSIKCSGSVGEGTNQSERKTCRFGLLCMNKNGAAADRIRSMCAKKSEAWGPRFTKLFCFELSGRRFFRKNVHAAALLVELNAAIREREESPVAARADVLARVKLGATLTNDDAASGYKLATVGFYAKALGMTITTVTDATLSFFMCHIEPILQITI